MSIRLISVKLHIPSPPAVQVILGQAHFIKTVEDLHEALVTAVPGIAFGLAFCEASEPCLVRVLSSEMEVLSWK
jgi:adenosine/AMP kinase